MGIMSDVPVTPAVRGKTMRWAWTDGPTQGQVYEHVFHTDGTVEWYDVTRSTRSRDKPGAGPRERPRYAAYEVTREVCAVSYLAPSGFTLTVVLNFANHSMVGFASSSDQWHPIRGTFEVVG